MNLSQSQFVDGSYEGVALVMGFGCNEPFELNGASLNPARIVKQHCSDRLPAVRYRIVLPGQTKYFLAPLTHMDSLSKTAPVLRPFLGWLDEEADHETARLWKRGYCFAYIPVEFSLPVCLWDFSLKHCPRAISRMGFVRRGAPVPSVGQDNYQKVRYTLNVVHGLPSPSRMPKKHKSATGVH